MVCFRRGQCRSRPKALRNRYRRKGFFWWYVLLFADSEFQGKRKHLKPHQRQRSQKNPLKVKSRRSKLRQNPSNQKRPRNSLRNNLRKFRNQLPKKKLRQNPPNLRLLLQPLEAVKNAGYILFATVSLEANEYR